MSIIRISIIGVVALAACNSPALASGSIWAEQLDASQTFMMAEPMEDSDFTVYYNFNSPGSGTRYRTTWTLEVELDVGYPPNYPMGVSPAMAIILHDINDPITALPLGAPSAAYLGYDPNLNVYVFRYELSWTVPRYIDLHAQGTILANVFEYYEVIAQPAPYYQGLEFISDLILVLFAQNSGDGHPNIDNPPSEEKVNPSKISEDSSWSNVKALYR